jgi:hypothetical protein
MKTRRLAEDRPPLRCEFGVVIERDMPACSARATKHLLWSNDNDLYLCRRHARVVRKALKDD